MKNKIMNMPKNLKIALGAVILVVIIALIARGAGHKKAAPAPVAPAPVVEESAAPVVKKPGAKPTPTPVVDTRGYAELITAYKNSMLQFGSLCQVVVSNQTYKRGEKMLLDNRNSTPVTIKLGANTYTLAGYGHQVITLEEVGSFMVDCNEHQNVATVSVQK